MKELKNKLNETEAAARAQMLLGKIQGADGIDLNGNGIGHSVCSRNNFKRSFQIEEDFDDCYCQIRCLIKMKDLAEAEIIKNTIRVKALDLGLNKQGHVRITLYETREVDLSHLST